MDFHNMFFKLYSNVLSILCSDLRNNAFLDISGSSRVPENVTLRYFYCSYSAIHGLPCIYCSARYDSLSIVLFDS